MTSFTQALLAGASAGTAVDILFFPLDSLKTRLQSSQGFIRAGGFSGVYRGLGSVVAGSAPGAATFFTTYEQLKKVLPASVPAIRHEDAFVHMLAASGGETTACLIRVPTEVVKQRQQTSAYGLHTTSLQALRRVVADTGISGLYQGFGTTVAREIPFCCIQFPLYERLKALVKSRRYPHSTSPLPASEASLCGSIAGAVAAALTTPLDVAKTRIMLSHDKAEGTLGMLGRIVREEGGSALWKGVVPRTTWIGLGGAVFLGVYEKSLGVLQSFEGDNVK